MGLWMPTPSEHPTGYLGGYHNQQRWRAAWPTSMPNGAAATRHVSMTLQGGSGPIDMALRTLRSPWPPLPTTPPGSRDSSAPDLPRAILPAPELLGLLEAQWSCADPADTRALGLGPVETEYS